MTRLVGARVPRVEDPRLLRGRGHFVDDLQPPGLRHAAFVRSPFAHARVDAIDATAARAMPGVDLVLTAADLDDVVGVMRGAGPEGLHTPAFGPLASDRVRFVGDPVAIVVAASRALAEDACELVDVDVRPVARARRRRRRTRSDAPAVFDEVGHNLMFEGHWTYGDPDAQFARARRVRDAGASPNTGSAMRRSKVAPVWSTTTPTPAISPTTRLTRTRTRCGSSWPTCSVIPAHRFHVHVGDMGGSFGQKAYISREDVAVCAAGTLLGQPVKWIEDRVENLQAAGQAREERFDVEAAYDDDGTVRGGARRHGRSTRAPTSSRRLPPTIFPTIVRVLFPGAYRLARPRVPRARSSPPTRRPTSRTAVRGRPRPSCASACSTRSRPTSDWHPRWCASAISSPPMSSRPVSSPTCRSRTSPRARRSSAPWSSPTSTGSVARRTQHARRRSAARVRAAPPSSSPRRDRPTTRRRSGPARRRGARSARPRASSPTAPLTVFTSQSPHGQGHDTTLAQLAADELGVPLDLGARGHRRHQRHAVQPGGHGREPRRRRSRAAR